MSTTTTTDYTLHHINEYGRQISAPTFTEARRLYLLQWRLPDGSIPWRMYATTWDASGTRALTEVEVNPFTGAPV